MHGDEQKRFFSLQLIFFAVLAFSISLVEAASSQRVGEVSFLEGSAVEVSSKRKSKALRVGTPIRSGITYRTENASRLEIRYDRGNVIRLDESSEIVLDGAENPEISRGSLWLNIRKLNDPSFFVKTPMATAAVRGTIFSVDVASPAESESLKTSTLVALYRGALEVGLTGNRAGSAVESPGAPKEVPGPHEVTLDEWIAIRPGELIDVHWDGSYQTRSIDTAAPKEWIRFNQSRDSTVVR